MTIPLRATRFRPTGGNEAHLPQGDPWRGMVLVYSHAIPAMQEDAAERVASLLFDA